ncbi:MAG: outer membrane beta-barrel protein [Flavobacteriaceae bacterium]
MSRKLFFLILSLCLSNMVVGQSHSVTGRVVSEGETPIDLANVLLFAVKDTALLQGTITDGFGNFKFTDVVKGRYFIQAALINRKTDLLPINVEHNLNLGTLLLPDAVVLDEVVLTDTKPLIERLPDRIVFNVQGSSMVNEDLWYVLGHTPRVMITGDVLSVQGEGDVGVLINGRLVNLPQQDIINLLSGTSAQGIESIEVITDPPAKYAAEYASIINIKSKKNLVAGHNGSVHYRHRQGTYPKAALGTDHFFKGRKTGFSFSYTYQDDRELNRYMDQTDFFGDGVSSHWEVRQKRDRKRDRHNLNLFFDYDFDARNRLSISSLGYYAPKRNTLYFSHSNVAETLPSPSNYDNYTDNLKVEDRFINSYYIDFVHDYEEKGKTLSLTAHYTQDAKGMSQDVQSDTYGSDGNLTDSYTFDIDSDVGIGLFSSQVDFTRPLAHGKWETGARFSSIASDVNLYQDGSFPPSQGEFVESALFQCREQFYAGYFSYNQDKGPWKT